jgi:hypothetical protein
MNMGLVILASNQLNDCGRFSDLDIQYGTGIVQFYPGLGGDAPPGWEIPCLIPSDVQGLGPVTQTSDPFNSASDLCLPVLNSHSNSPANSFHDEVILVCPSCLNCHNDPCPRSFSKPDNSSPALSGLAYPSPTRLLPSLEFNGDSSDSSDDDDYNPQSWEELQDEICEELAEEHRLMQEDKEVEQFGRESLDRLVPVFRVEGALPTETDRRLQVHTGPSLSDDTSMALQRQKLHELLKSKCCNSSALLLRLRAEASSTECSMPLPLVRDTPLMPSLLFNPPPIQVFCAQADQSLIAPTCLATPFPNLLWIPQAISSPLSIKEEIVN